MVCTGGCLLAPSGCEGAIGPSLGQIPLDRPPHPTGVDSLLRFRRLESLHRDVADFLDPEGRSVTTGDCCPTDTDNQSVLADKPEPAQNGHEATAALHGVEALQPEGHGIAVAGIEVIPARKSDPESHP